MQFREFDQRDHRVWSLLFEGLEDSRSYQAHPLFLSGLNKLGFCGERIPKLHEINAELRELTGWEGVPVKGLVDNKGFFQLLAEKKFPIGNFIRGAEVLSYTPEPDIFHDLYGHLPFFADFEYANFCFQFGKVATKYLLHDNYIEQFARLFWYGVEFPLIKCKGENRIFGGGILSSAAECDYCLSDEPELVDFDVEHIRRQPYYIDDMQTKLFVLANPAKLYTCLYDFEKGLRHIDPTEDFAIKRREEAVLA